MISYLGRNNQHANCLHAEVRPHAVTNKHTCYDK